MSMALLRKEKSKVENQIKKLEEKSIDAEDHLKQLNLDFVNPEIACDFVKLMDVQAEIEKYQNMIDKFANEWLEKNDLLTKLTSLCEQNNDNENE